MSRKKIHEFHEFHEFLYFYSPCNSCNSWTIFENGRKNDTEIRKFLFAKELQILPPFPMVPIRSH
ncbi:MAG: hypothetical protein KAW47_04670, partial [Thermoplasmatales archaeon]|nr:hypothetical protein [Thermoplasmatales archaeon]